MSEGESMYGTTLSQESIKVIAESIGVGNFPDEAAKELAEDVSYRLKEIVQVCYIKYSVYFVVTYTIFFYKTSYNIKHQYYRMQQNS